MRAIAPDVLFPGHPAGDRPPRIHLQLPQYGLRVMARGVWADAEGVGNLAIRLAPGQELGHFGLTRRQANGLSSGLYFIRLQAKGQVLMRKITVVR
jgi:hypothetical protein